MKKWQVAVLAVIIAIIVVVLGFLGLLFFANKDDVVTKQTGDSGLDKTIPVTRSMPVDQWGIVMTTSDLVDPGYTIKDDKTLLFSSGTQKMLSNGCSFKNQVEGPWGVKRYKASEPHPDKLVAAGDYVYEFIEPKTGCGDQYKAVIQTLNNSYNSMYQSIKTK